MTFVRRAADDEDAFRAGARDEAEVGDHLLVGELVALGALDGTVKDEDVAVGVGLEDEHVLVQRALDVQDVADGAVLGNRDDGARCPIWLRMIRAQGTGVIPVSH